MSRGRQKAPFSQWLALQRRLDHELHPETAQVQQIPRKLLTGAEQSSGNAEWHQAG